MVERFERFSLAISEISKCWHKITSDEMEKYGLKGSHSVYLLTMLRYANGITAPQLCEECCKDKADVSRMMSIMEDKGLVTKDSIYQNHYRAVYQLTDKGKEAAGFVRERASLAVELAGKELVDEKRTIFYEGLEIIAKSLREISEEGLPKQ